MQIQPKEENINDLALSYMAQKYGEEFEYASPWGNSMTGTHQLMVKCDSLGDQTVLVQIENYKEDNKIFSDNYLTLKYCEDTVKFIEDCADEVFGECKVVYRPSRAALSPALPPDASFSDFLSEGKTCITAGIYVKESAFGEKEQAEKVTEKISEAFGSEYLEIFVIIISDADYERFDEFIENKGKYIRCARLTRQNGISVLDWLEGE